MAALFGSLILMLFKLYSKAKLSKSLYRCSEWRFISVKFILLLSDTSLLNHDSEFRIEAWYSCRVIVDSYTALFVYLKRSHPSTYYTYSHISSRGNIVSVIYATPTAPRVPLQIIAIDRDSLLLLGPAKLATVSPSRTSHTSNSDHALPMSG